MSRPDTASEVTHFVYVPFTGLGAQGGYRGDAWLRNRIAIFKRFVLPSLLQQSRADFILLVSWRPEESTNPLVRDFQEFLETTELRKVIFTFHGVLFWDDIHEDAVAAERLRRSLAATMPLLAEFCRDWVYLTIQPSDDLYDRDAFEAIRSSPPSRRAIGFRKGYIMRYATGELSEYDPTTIPPFYTVCYDRETFLDPGKHFDYIHNASHERVADFVPFHELAGRGFLVGCHGENISTYYNIPFRGATVDDPEKVLGRFGIRDSRPLVVGRGWRRLQWLRYYASLLRKSWNAAKHAAQRIAR